MHVCLYEFEKYVVVEGSVGGKVPSGPRCTANLQHDVEAGMRVKILRFVHRKDFHHGQRLRIRYDVIPSGRGGVGYVRIACRCVRCGCTIRQGAHINPAFLHQRLEVCDITKFCIKITYDELGPLGSHFISSRMAAMILLVRPACAREV